MDIDAIEEQRQKLDSQIEKLRQSLKHWQTWDAEYEGLKEELQSTGAVNSASLSALASSYDGSLLNESEINDIFGLTTNNSRSRDQIINMIDRRIEYVTKNIETISHQFYAAESKLEEFAFASSIASGQDPRFDDEDEPKQSLVEIHEELDDDDNVVSSRLRDPEEETRRILERLHGQTKEKSASTTHDDGIDHAIDDRETDAPHRPVAHRKKSVSFSADTKAIVEPVRTDSSEGRKSVSFAPKIAIAPAADPPDARSVSFSPTVEEIPAPTLPSSPEIQRADLQKDLRASFKPGEKVYELNEDDQPASQHIVLPDNESAEDARLRRDMLNYHLNEVGDIMAQVDLEEGEDVDDHSDFTGSEYLEEGDTPYTTSDEEDEDEFGRSKHDISSDYHAEMARLQAQLIGNLGPNPDNQQLNDVDTELDPKDVRRLVIRNKRSSMSSAASSSEGEKKSSAKKRVSFAQALDVADSPPQKVQRKDAEEETVEGGENVEASGPIVADQLVERTTSSNVTEPGHDGEDEMLLRRELANQYHKHRNDMIREQGGFRQNPEDEELGQLMEERDGKIKKVSRFKAARLRD